jgi:hypothetical protein
MGVRVVKWDGGDLWRSLGSDKERGRTDVQVRDNIHEKQEVKRDGAMPDGDGASCGAK